MLYNELLQCLQHFYTVKNTTGNVCFVVVSGHHVLKKQYYSHFTIFVKLQFSRCGAVLSIDGAMFTLKSSVPDLADYFSFWLFKCLSRNLNLYNLIMIPHAAQILQRLSLSDDMPSLQIIHANLRCYMSNRTESQKSDQRFTLRWK